MRNLSFALTTKQIRDRTKTVTRRRGTWWAKWLRPGDLLCAVEKSQGIKKGELVRLCVIRIVSVRTEPLDEMQGGPTCGRTDEYGDAEAAREGFPDLGGAGFVAMFLGHMGGSPDQIVTRIEFEYVEEDSNV